MLHQIGSGVLGPVFRTYEPQRDRLVAVKAFRLDIVPEDVARLAGALRRLVASGPVHPNIVTLLEAGLEGTTAFLAMNYIAGETLDVALRHISPAPLDRAVPVLACVAEAIDAAWAAGHGHGALHPRDIFLDPGSADVVLTGIGIVPALESIGVKVAVRRPYAAPERLEGRAWDRRADVYSLGAIAHELLTRRRPAGPGEQDGALSTGLAPEQRVLVRRVLAAALAEHPDYRFDSSSAFLKALAAVSRGEDPGPLPEAPPASEGAAVGVAPGPSGSSDVEERRGRPLFAALEAPAFDGTLPLGPDREPPSATSLEEFPPEEQAPAEETVAVDSDPPSDPPAPPPPDPEPGFERPVAAPVEPAMQPHAEPVLRRENPAFAPATPMRHSTSPMFGTQLTPPSPSFPWLAIAAVAVASLIVGGVVGYQLGQRRAAPQGPPVVSASPAPPATPAATDTDVPVTTPPAATATPAPAESAQVVPPVRQGAPATGQIIVRSVPTGALVTVDGRTRGTTPETLGDLSLGVHTVQVARPGYTPASRRVTLTASRPKSEISVTLRAAVGEPGTQAGSLVVDSRPRGARVTLDGRDIGVTPVRVPSVSVGTHSVRIELEGYRGVTSQVVVKPGEQASSAVTLERAHPMLVRRDRP